MDFCIILYPDLEEVDVVGRWAMLTVWGATPMVANCLTAGQPRASITPRLSSPTGMHFTDVSCTAQSSGMCLWQLHAPPAAPAPTGLAQPES